MTDLPISVVIPAHDEAAVIGRLLDALSDREADDEVVVVCDGCTDDTADVARRWPGVVVVEQSQAGKPAALNRGDRVARLYPRFYVDADIVVSTAALREIARTMHGPVLAGSPAMQVDLTGASWAVRAYYDVWTRLPYASRAILGSGVIGLTAEGRARFGDFPDVIGDDEFVRRRFAVSERTESPTTRFVVTAPRRLAPLIRIKTRSRLGILQLDELEGPAPPEAGATGSRELARLLGQPRRWSAVAVYVVVRALTTTRARRRLVRQQFRWDRDDSSRSAAPA
jgi:glycosyltransferase involved in cell wall biosynthesis